MPKEKSELPEIKPKWHCANDPFLFCSEMPDWEVEPQQVRLAGALAGSPTYPLKGKCKLNPATCGKALFLSQQYKPEELARLAGTLKESISPTSKSCSAKKKKVKPEQERLF